MKKAIWALMFAGLFAAARGGDHDSGAEDGETSLPDESVAESAQAITVAGVANVEIGKGSLGLPGQRSCTPAECAECSERVRPLASLSLHALPFYSSYPICGA